ncbi:superoxide-generating NADPH oxidase flavocytochrome [Tieghemostelium lacteum]|uniref:Superoxide-generating NADPH oxidase flavocytochrome n=1 Tax=Tieghemostelium lacteum TaxID=361077 RepID=A0A151ZJZ5_TIELA|nr:superoxide-generating NADPH oxidase flavocytochrome [Tieghemostelium lacteum]|eukprot:KYQ94318.1 superoxide-generating NADPH oxidase flavocytochrome [Tieghemostelium lacteum]
MENNSEYFTYEGSNNSNNNLIEEQISPHESPHLNPLGLPHELTKSDHLRKSHFSQLDASLYELPNIGVDKIQSNLSSIEQLLISKFKENESTIRDYIKQNESKSRTLIINKETFSRLFNIFNFDQIDQIFNLFYISNNTYKNSNKKKKLKINNYSNSASNNNNIKKNQRNKRRFGRKKNKNDNTLTQNQKSFSAPQIFTELPDFINKNTLSDFERISNSDNRNTLKIPIGGNSFPIPIESPKSDTTSADLQSNISDSNSSCNTTILTSNNTIQSVTPNEPSSTKSVESKISYINSPIEVSKIGSSKFSTPTSNRDKINSNSSPNKPTPQQLQPPTSSASAKLKSKFKKNQVSNIEEINLFEVINQIYLLLSKNGSEEEQLKSIFNLYDIYDNGYISRDDLKEVLYFRVKQSGLSFSDYTFECLLDHIFEQFDKNQDGIIDFQEFKEELTKKKSPTPSKMEKKTHNVRRYFRIEGLKILFFIIYIMINVGLVFATYYSVSTHQHHAIMLFGKGLYLTRIAAQLVIFNATIILLTMCKQIITWLRSTKLKKIIPLDKYVTFHKLIAVCLILASLVHTFGWFVAMGIASTKPDKVFYGCLYPHFIKRPTVWGMIFLSLPGMTGLLMVLILLLIAVFSCKIIRKKHFELFYYTHHLFVIFFVLLLAHGTMGWIKPPTFWKWFLAPAVIYLIDRGFRMFKKTYRVNLYSVSLKDQNVVVLKFQKPQSFNYEPGQYLLLNVPHLSNLQWHPFTMTSSPLENVITLHIRVIGGWTKELHQYLQKIENDNAVSDIEECDRFSKVQMRIDGPFGSSSQYALNCKQVILVGAGIGVTPMTSLLQDMKIKKEYHMYGQNPSYQMAQKDNYDLGKLEKVHFFWLNRDPICFQWFEDLLVEIAKCGSKAIPKISINTFNTRCFPKHDVRIFMLWNGLDKLFNTQGIDPTTNLPFKTHWGRPNWDAILTYYSNKYKGQEIGVFCCGPKELSKELYEKCRFYTTIKGTKFIFHKENF